MKAAIFACCLTVLFSLVAVSPDAQAEPDPTTGNGLLPMCKSAIIVSTNKASVKLTDEQNIGGVYCIAFVRGFWRGSDIAYALIERANAREKRKPQERYWCPPKDYSTISDTQIIRVFVKFLENQPEQLHKPPEVLLGMALTQAFPCK